MSEFKHMLAQEIHGFEEVEKLLSTHCVEEKFDGARIIVFFDEKGEYKIINREGRDITEQCPLSRNIPHRSSPGNFTLRLIK